MFSSEFNKRFVSSKNQNMFSISKAFYCPPIKSTFYCTIHYLSIFCFRIDIPTSIFSFLLLLSLSFPIKSQRNIFAHSFKKCPGVTVLSSIVSKFDVNMKLPLRALDHYWISNFYVERDYLQSKLVAYL